MCAAARIAAASAAELIAEAPRRRRSPLAFLGCNFLLAHHEATHAHASSFLPGRIACRRPSGRVDGHVRRPSPEPPSYARAAAWRTRRRLISLSLSEPDPSFSLSGVRPAFSLPFLVLSPREDYGSAVVDQQDLHSLWNSAT